MSSDGRGDPISALTALAGADTDASNDKLPVLDVSATRTKHITVAQLYTALSQTGVFVSVKEPRYGAVGNGSTDDLAAINAASLAVESAGGGILHFPKTSSYYSCTVAPTARQGVIFMGEGYGSYIRVTSTSNSWDSAGFIFGNYGSAQASAISENIPSIFAETRYSVGAITPGRTVTCSTVADAANFAEGNIVQIGSAEMTSTGYEKYQMLNEVVSADAATGIVTLKHKIPDAMAVTTTEGELYFSSGATMFTAGRTLTGGTSGATCVIAGVFMGSNIKYVGVNTIAVSTFQAGETVTESVSGATAVIATGGVQLNPMIRKLNTGNVTGLDGNIAKVIVRGGLKNLRIVQAKTTGNAYQCIHFAAYECDFENLWLTGYDGFGGNPMGFCRGRNLRIQHRRVGFEAAYCFNNNDIEMEITRIADSATAFQGGFLSSEDGGADNKITVNVTNEFGTVSTNGAVGIQKARTELHAKVQGSIGAGVGFTTGADGSIGYLKVMNPGTHGYSVNCPHVQIIAPYVRGTTAANFAGKYTTSALYCTTIGGDLGDPASINAQDRISDDNGRDTTNQYIGVMSRIKQRATYQPQGTTFGNVNTGAAVAETAMEDYTILANTMIVGIGFSFKMWGNVPAADTAGEKNVRIRLGPSATALSLRTELARIQFTPGSATGHFWVEGKIVAQSSGSYALVDLKSNAGTVTTDTSVGATAAFTADAVLSSTYQLANDNDSVVLRNWEVVPTNDDF